MEEVTVFLGGLSIITLFWNISLQNEIEKLNKELISELNNHIETKKSQIGLIAENKDKYYQIAELQRKLKQRIESDL